MSGIGEAITVLSVLQSGYSVATTLTTYLSDVRGARDDVQSLASELDSTLRHLEELDKLTSHNKSKSWTANGEGLVKNCKADADKVIKNLIKLLRNSGQEVVISPDKVFNRDDIDLKIFRKATWPIYKPQVELVKRELVLIKFNIFLARDLYRASNEKSPSARRKAKLRLGGIDRAIAKSTQDLEKEMRRAAEPTVETVIRDTPGATAAYRVRRHASDDASSEDASTADSDSDSDDLQQTRLEHAREIIEAEMQEAQYEKAQTEAANRLLRDEAVARYKQDLLEVLTKRKRDADQMTDDLTKAFEPALPIEQIRQFVHKQHLSEFGDGTLKELADQLLVNENQDIKSPTEQASQQGSARFVLSEEIAAQANLARSFLSFRSSRSSKSKSKSDLPSALLRHETMPDCARIMSINVAWFRKKVVVEPIHVSMQWLVKHMKTEEKKGLKHGMYQTMDVWAKLPDDYRTAVKRWFKDNTTNPSAWSLIFARENVEKPSKKRRFLQTLLGDELDSEELISVVLVYRRSQFLEEIIHPHPGSPLPARQQAATPAPEGIEADIADSVDGEVGRHDRGEPVERIVEREYIDPPGAFTPAVYPVRTDVIYDRLGRPHPQYHIPPGPDYGPARPPPWPPYTRHDDYSRRYPSTYPESPPMPPRRPPSGSSSRWDDFDSRRSYKQGYDSDGDRRGSRSEARTRERDYSRQGPNAYDNAYDDGFHDGYDDGYDDHKKYREFKKGMKRWEEAKAAARRGSSVTAPTDSYYASGRGSLADEKQDFRRGRRLNDTEEEERGRRVRFEDEVDTTRTRRKDRDSFVDLIQPLDELGLLSKPKGESSRKSRSSIGAAGLSTVSASREKVQDDVDAVEEWLAGGPKKNKHRKAAVKSVKSEKEHRRGASSTITRSRDVSSKASTSEEDSETAVDDDALGDAILAKYGLLESAVSGKETVAQSTDEQRTQAEEDVPPVQNHVNHAAVEDDPEDEQEDQPD